jgi:hypothetical protein
MEKYEKCEHHICGKTQEKYFMKNKIVFCEISPKNCPYEQGKRLEWEGEEFVGNICKGLTRKLQEQTNSVV